MSLCSRRTILRENAKIQFRLTSKCASRNNIHLNRRKNIFTLQIRFSAPDVPLYWQYYDSVTMGWNVPFSHWHPNVDPDLSSNIFAIRINCSIFDSHTEKNLHPSHTHTYTYTRARARAFSTDIYFFYC